MTKKIYEGYKFANLKDILLYSIAKNKRPKNIEDLYRLHSEIDKRNIYDALRKLEAEKLVKKYNKWGRGNIMIGLHEKNLKKIKKILGGHWESGWEVDWKYAAKS